MQASKHIGKVVVSGFDDISTADQPVPARTRLSLSPERTYMISGGLSGFGLATARWMVQKGARHLAIYIFAEASYARLKTRLHAFLLSAAHLT